MTTSARPFRPASEEEEIAFAMWRLRRLRGLEVEVLLAAGATGDTDEPDDARRLPSLGTLVRYRSRIERDLRLAQEALTQARAADTAGGTDGPDLPPPPQRLNRQQRRRLERLGQQRRSA